MEQKLKFIYHKEYWYLSAFINNERLNEKEQTINDQIEEILVLIERKLKSLKKEDLYPKLKEEDKERVVELANNISIKCRWISHIKNFPYGHENIDEEFDELGSFEFDVEYFRDSSKEKASILPIIIQQIPYIIKDLIVKYSHNVEKKFLFVDAESFLYIFVISTRSNPDKIKWSPDNISKYKLEIGQWTEIYSGSWPDYSEALYDRRIKYNLSNRVSELHFLRRNSGFIYMEEDNYKKFFEGYMYNKVLLPTAKIRAISFALLSIDDSLDTFTSKRRIERTLKEKQSIKMKKESLTKIKQFRERIQENMSEFIFNELVLNRRQHETAVLQHLLDEFKINETYDRISEKFEMIYGEMQDIFLKHQEALEHSMARLNILIISGVFADIITFLIQAFGTFNIVFFTVNILSSLLMFSILGFVLFNVVKLRLEKTEKLDAVVGIVLNKAKDKILMIERANRPFKKMLSLPGRYIEKNKIPEEEIKQEVFEEAGLDIEIIEPISKYKYKEVYDMKTFVYLCSLESDPDKKRIGGNALSVELIKIEELKGEDLAFDHDIILKNYFFPKTRTNDM